MFYSSFLMYLFMTSPERLLNSTQVIVNVPVVCFPGSKWIPQQQPVGDLQGLKGGGHPGPESSGRACRGSLNARVHPEVVVFVRRLI